MRLLVVESLSTIGDRMAMSPSCTQYLTRHPVLFLICRILSCEEDEAGSFIVKMWRDEETRSLKVSVLDLKNLICYPWLFLQFIEFLRSIFIPTSVNSVRSGVTVPEAIKDMLDF